MKDKVFRFLQNRNAKLLLRLQSRFIYQELKKKGELNNRILRCLIRGTQRSLEIYEKM